ncbi:hypothetical protein CTAYLR_005947 [Chrysophaeum taylorii]|uniref:Uncharacterized protein n=1 Tax=Chrysophaeum taylorii TaxID=2483200 RepID=A0AAD7UCK1_9STRA|nr:hypothetical protein CTAYLR_005947 [Chrysophaeum taylorii]
MLQSAKGRRLSPVEVRRQEEIELRLHAALDEQNKTIVKLHQSLIASMAAAGQAETSAVFSGSGENSTTWKPIALGREDWVVYLRVQKTGSQTLWLSLVDAFNGRVWGRPRCAKGPFCGFRCERVLSNAFVEARRQNNCRLFVRAHANWRDYAAAATLAGVPHHRLRWLALLREPVARARSEYEHVTRGLVAQFGDHAFGRAWDYNFTDKRRASLGEWLDCAACRVGSSNRQTRFLAGLAPTGSRDDERRGDATLLAAALDNLRRCDFVGLLDRYADSMLLLRETFPAQLGRFTAYSLSLHPKQKQHNDQEPRGDNSKAVLDRLHDLNRLDARLFEVAGSIFEARWAAMLRSLPPNRRGMRFRPTGSRSFVLG